MNRKLLLLLGGVLLTVAGLALAWYWPFGDQGSYLQLPGTVEIQEVRLGSKVGGRVAEVRTREGDQVVAGQVLVRFEAPELEAQREQWQARLQAAAAVLDKARTGARLEEKDAARAAAEAARARWKLLKIGARPEEIRQARADLKTAEASLKLAQQELQRMDWLMSHSREAGSATELDSRRAELNRAQARLDSAQARLDLLVAGNRPEEIDEAAAQLKRAEADLRLLLNGTRSEDVAEAEAKVAEARGKLHEVEASLREAIVRAPGPAVVEVLAVRAGDLVLPNQPVLRVLRADDLWVKVFVPETQLGKVRLGQDVEVRIDSYPGQSFAGAVMQIAGESEFTPRNVQSADERRHQVFAIKVRVANPQGVFKSGMAAEVRLPL